MTQTTKDYRAIFRRLSRTFYVCVINFKGGVGKTTSASHMAYYFAAVLGLKTLLVDCDFQANSGKVFLKEEQIHPPTLTHVLRCILPLHTAIRQIREGIPLYLLPSDTDLDQAAKYLISMGSVGHKLLRASLSALEQGKMLDDPRFGVNFAALPGGMIPPIPAELALEAFDVVIFDCASLNAVVENAFYASDAIYIPVGMQYLSVDGLYTMKKKLDRLMAQLEHQLIILGITPYNTDERFRLTKEYRDLIRADFQTDVTSSIRTDATVGAAQEQAKTIFEYDHRAKYAIDFSIMAEELYERIEGILLVEEEMRNGARA